MNVKNNFKVSKYDYIEIDNLELSCRVGCTQEEQGFPQLLLISIILFLPLKKPGTSDKIEHTVDYAKLIKAIRATSLKGITHYLSVFTDSIIYLYDTLTWQNKIQEISMEAIDNWAQDVEGAVRKYIDEFKETNRREIMSLFDELTQEFSEDETDDVIEDIDHETLIKLKREIDFILHKCLFASI